MDTQEELIQQYGSMKTSRVLERLYSFAYISPKIIENIQRQALDEDWGKDFYVLKKYIAITVYWSLEQGRFAEYQDGFIVTAGLLRSRYSVPIYLRFERNNNPSATQPWALTFAGSGDNIKGVAELPAAPEVPKPPEIPVGNEIVVRDEHILGQRSDRVPFLQGVGAVAQICALTGAIQWSIYRGLQQLCWYFGKMQYYIPIYLQNQENITATPDLIVPIEIRQSTTPLSVRTALDPLTQTTYYSNIRPVVARADQLQPWIVSSWAAATKADPSDSVEE